MTVARCSEIRHRFERERNALLDAKQRETESKLRQEITTAKEGLEDRTTDLKDWIVATETMNQKRWEESEKQNREWWVRMDNRIYGLYVLLAFLIIAITLAMYFQVDISGLIP